MVKWIYMCKWEEEVMCLVYERCLAIWGNLGGVGGERGDLGELSG